MEINNVCVVGMGTMGSQIGIVCARGGFRTILVDLSEESIKKGLGSIKSFLSSQVRKERMKGEEMEEVLSLITTTTDLAKALSDVTLVIEAVFEDIDVKEGVVQKNGWDLSERSRSDEQHVHVEHYGDRSGHRSTGKMHRNTFLDSGGLDAAC